MHHAVDPMLSEDSLHGEPAYRVRGFGIPNFVKDAVGVGRGIVEGAVDTVTGVVDAVTNPVETAEGIGQLFTNPGEAFPAMWDAIKGPIEDDWKQGNQGEAIGRGIFGVAEVIFGAKGLTKVGKVGTSGKAADAVPDAPRPPVRPKPDGGAPSGPDRPGGGGGPDRPGGGSGPDRPGAAPDRGDAPDRPDPGEGRNVPGDDGGTGGPDTPEGPDGRRDRGAPVHDAATAAAVAKLEAAGIKFTKGDVVFADELPPNSIIDAKAGVAFLERGNPKAGLEHILHGSAGKPGHLDDFARRGVAEADVPQLIRDAITKGDVKAGPKSGSYDIAVDFQGTRQKLRVAIGNNGFVVSAYPI